jgi:hypothetical protein
VIGGYFLYTMGQVLGNRSTLKHNTKGQLKTEYRAETWKNPQANICIINER